jgi:hypothetical protein
MSASRAKVQFRVPPIYIYIYTCKLQKIIISIINLWLSVNVRKIMRLFAGWRPWFFLSHWRSFLY